MTLTDGREIGPGAAVVLRLLIALVALGCQAPVAPPSEPPTSAAAGGDVHALLPGDAESVFGVGDRVKVGNELYILLGAVEMDVTPPDGAPPSGRMYAAFLVAFEGIALDGSSYHHLSVQDDRGVEYSAAMHGKEPALAFSDGLTGEMLELGPGEQAHGWVTYEVPTETAWIDLVYRPDVRFVVRFRVTP